MSESITYDDLPRLMARVFRSPTVESKGKRFVYRFDAGPANLPAYIDATHHDCEVLAATVADLLGIPALAEDTKQELWDAVSSFFEGDRTDGGKS